MGQPKASQLLDAFVRYSDDYQKCNQAVSSVSVGWHIVHSCLVISKVTDTLIQSNPNEFTRKFSFKKLLVFTFNKFPRGKAKAPQVVIPNQELSLETIQASIEAAKESIQKLVAAKPNQFFTHPIFGKVNKKDTIRFFYVHTSHHLKIIQDILSS